MVSKKQMAKDSYEVLNFLAGDVISAHFFYGCIENLEKNNPRNRYLTHYKRNTLRLIASVFYRYTEIYKKRIGKLGINLTNAQQLDGRLTGNKLREFRHLFEHELSIKTNEPHSPEQVEEHFKNANKFLGEDFKKACLDLSKQFMNIRDTIAKFYPDCGSGVDRWKIGSINNDVKLNFAASTMPASIPQKVSKVKKY